MSLLNFKLEGDARQVNTLRQVIKAKLPVLVLQDVIVAVNTTQYDNQYIEDRMGNIPIHTLTTSFVGHEVRLVYNNSTQDIKMMTTNDLIVTEVETKETIFLPTELRTFDGVMHTLPIEIIDLKPGENIEITCTIRRAYTGDNGRYIVAPVCYFKGVIDEAAASKAYEKIPEELKTEEYRKNWEMLYSHQHTVPNMYTFVIETLQNSAYTNTSAIVAACDIIIDNITASKMWKVKIEEEDSTHMEIVMDEYVGYLFEHALFGKAGIQFVKYGKRHPHDASGTLRIKTVSVDIDVTKLIQSAVEPLRRFYVGIATGVGGKKMHPNLQKALDAFKRSSFAEKRERLIELGVDRDRAETSSEDDLNTMAEVWLQQTERRAIDSAAEKVSKDEIVNEERPEKKEETDVSTEKIKS